MSLEIQKVKVQVPVETPVNLTEHIPAGKVVDLPVTLKEVQLEVGPYGDTPAQIVAIDLQSHACTNFRKNPFDDGAAQYLGYQGNWTFSVNTVDIHGQRVKVFEAISDDILAVTVHVQQMGAIDRDDSTLTLRKPNIHLVQVHRHDGTTIPAEDHVYRQVDVVVGRLKLLHAYIEVPFWDGPINPEPPVREEVLLLPLPELLQWLQTTSQAMESPVLSGMDGEIELEDEADVTNSYRVVPDWAQTPVIYQVTKK